MANEPQLVADTEQTPKPDAEPDKAVEQNPIPDVEPDKVVEQNRKRSRSSSTKRKRNFALCDATFPA